MNPNTPNAAPAASLQPPEGHAMTKRLTLVSHPLCPYVQRAAIVLREKGLDFEQIDIDLAHKPDWFLKISPLGKTPVLLVDGAPIFESAVICEYLEDTALPRLHPSNALERARHRAWMEFGSALLNAIAAFYNAADDAALAARARDIRARLKQLEPVLSDGDSFNGTAFSMVDAVFGPVFRYFDVIDAAGDFGFWDDLPKVQRWRAALARRPSVVQAARPEYPKLLRRFLVERRSALSRVVEPLVAFV